MIDVNRAAVLIRGALGVQKRSQKDVSRETGVSYCLLSLYLNRRIDLIPSDVERVLDELGLSSEKTRASIELVPIQRPGKL